MSVVIGMLATDVVQELRELRSAETDNLQWSIAQTEVEYLEFLRRLDASKVDLGRLRQKYDIFHSRIETIRNAAAFKALYESSDVAPYFGEIISFLDYSVEIIDSPDDELLRRLPELIVEAEDLRRSVRLMATASVAVFSDFEAKQRGAAAATLFKLCLVVAALVAGLAITIAFLKRLNAKINRREKIQNRIAARMNTIMKASLDGVIVSDIDGRILDFSPAAEEIFGHVAENVRGRLISDVIVPKHLRDLHSKGMERVRQNGERRVVGRGRVKLDAQHASGKIFPIELAIQSAVTDEGEMFIAFLRDISKQVADEEELVAARDEALASEKLKTSFLATVSHEIRTPLNGLMGNLQLLHDTSLGPKQARYVRNMETSGRLLMSHISSVLDITRYDAGMMNIRKEPMNVSSLLQDLVDSQSGTALANETTLEWGWDGQPMTWINSDHEWLQHVLMNLFGNAVKFTKRGKVTMTVKANQTDGGYQLTFEIKDTGRGMPESLRARIFDDFVTGDTAYDRDVGGTGLGLGIAKRFVTALGGTIDVDSVEGKGSTFLVKLPVEPADAPRVVIDDTPPNELDERLNILLIEDNEINRVVATEMLESEGHDVTNASDGLQGVQLAEQQAFDLILMDISMPVMDGRAATRAIRQGNGPSAATPIIALTANLLVEEQKNFLADGMNGIVYKPMTKESLRSVLHRRHRVTLEGPVETGVDRKHADETREALGDAVFGKLFSRFTTEVEELIATLQAEDRPAMSDIAPHAHRIAGSAAVFGATDLRDQLKHIENAAKRDDAAGLADLIATLPDLWRAAKAALR